MRSVQMGNLGENTLEPAGESFCALAKPNGNGNGAEAPKPEVAEHVAGD
jgi:hypothetical protein